MTIEGRIALFSNIDHRRDAQAKTSGRITTSIAVKLFEKSATFPPHRLYFSKLNLAAPKFLAENEKMLRQTCSPCSFKQAMCGAVNSEDYRAELSHRVAAARAPLAALQADGGPSL